MKPIISPWLIYFLSVLDGVNVVCAGIFILGLIGIPAALLVLYWMNDTTYGKEGEAAKKAFSGIKPYFIAYCIFLGVACFIPSKTTVYQMIVAKKLTPDNISAITQSAGDTAEDVADYVVDIITRVSEAVKDNE